MTIGFIGLGRLGTPIAANLLEKGHKLFVYNRTVSKAEELKNKGATVCSSVKELATQCEIVFTIVSDDAALHQVTEEDGLLQHLKPGSIHVSMSTILPATAEKLQQLHAEKKQVYLAAPVFGRPEAAAARKLNFVIAGEKELREKLEPVLKDAGGAGVWHFGDNVVSANTVKLCGNFMIAAALEAMGESINLAKLSGVDTEAMWDMFTQTLFTSPIYQNYGKVVLNRSFEPPAFTAKLGLKDLNLVLSQAAAAKVNMPTADLVKSNLQTLVNTGRENIDWSAVSLAAE